MWTHLPNNRSDTKRFSGVVLNAARSGAIISTVKEDIKELVSLKIYPNPAQATTWLDMELTEAATVTC